MWGACKAVFACTARLVIFSVTLATARSLRFLGWPMQADMSGYLERLRGSSRVGLPRVIRAGCGHRTVTHEYLVPSFCESGVICHRHERVGLRIHGVGCIGARWSKLPRPSLHSWDVYADMTRFAVTHTANVP